MKKRTLKKIEIEILYCIHTKEYYLFDHKVEILKTKDKKEIALVSKKFEQDDKYTVSFRRV